MKVIGSPAGKSDNEWKITADLADDVKSVTFALYYQVQSAKSTMTYVTDITVTGNGVFDLNEYCTIKHAGKINSVALGEATTIYKIEVPDDPEPEIPIFESITATNDAENPYVVPNSNHFCYAILDPGSLEEGVLLDLVVGNQFTKVGEVFVQLVDGKLVITLEGNGTFGAAAFDNLPETPNGNIHSLGQGGFHNNNNVIDLPVEFERFDAIYLYIHLATWQFPQ
ncbi:MAG: hypothetical protein FWH29_10810 [Methanobrevibacter sp.]|nr:hypothetical protein [Methanobrevibacter sp.]